MNMDKVMIRKNVSDIINDAHLAQVNDLSLLLFFTVLSKEEVLDETIFLEFNDVLSDIRLSAEKIVVSARRTTSFI